MAKCWAAALGDCSAEGSKEYYVSASLWDGPTVDVSGFPWCKDAPKTVSVASLASSILCKAHNNALSPLDAVAGHAFDVLRRATQLSNARQAAPKRYKTQRFEIAEPWLLGRWFLKTAINLGVLHPTPTRWRQTGEPLDHPPERLVKMAFGREPIERPLGLHWLASVGQQLAFVDGVTYAPLLYGEPPALISGLFTFRGLPFLMHFEPLALPSPLHLPNGKGVWRSGQLGYHLERLNWAKGKKVSHYVQFLWHLAPTE